MSPSAHPANNAAPALTRNQKLVLEALAGSDGPLTAYELLDRLRPAGLRAPPQIYRALDKLVALGRVHRIESRNAFVACCETHQHAGAVIFAICDECGHTEEFTDDALDARLALKAGDRHFTVERSTLELHGRCSRCAGTA